MFEPKSERFWSILLINGFSQGVPRGSSPELQKRAFSVNFAYKRPLLGAPERPEAKSEHFWQILFRSGFYREPRKGTTPKANVFGCFWL